MNALNSKDDQAFLEKTQASLLREGMGDLDAFAQAAGRLRSALCEMKDFGDRNIERRAEKMIRQIDTFEPSVTMIGQIKSGKTTLVNALVGAPDLLPADVNPWTSVVTSLHLHPHSQSCEKKANFQFFDADEWEKLISGGGRIGELASRAGADDELEKIKQQVIEMREKSRKRLGRKFEVLLGQNREYGYFDKELIERYVCLGEELEPQDGTFDAQGRFADITKAADLTMHRLSLPIRLCIRDTPGVNDTFMMREQITIRAIRDSRICVVILSAHQALSSSDLALIRLITHVKSRDVIIFVNRIDELSDPASEIDQIRTSIETTLRKHKGPQDVEVVFGSAIWASYSLQGSLKLLPPHCLKALKSWAEAKVSDSVTPLQITSEMAWQLSGLPALQAAISMRVCQGDGEALLHRIGASASNLIDGLSAADAVVGKQPDLDEAEKLDCATAEAAMKELVARESESLRKTLAKIIEGFSDRMERVQDSFLERATASLVLHLERYGEETPWTYDPAGLRVLLASSHKVLARKTQAAFDAAARSATEETFQIYRRAFSLGPEDMQIVLPRAPAVPAPVSLGQTIALDLSSSWWKRWWIQKRGYQAYATRFFELIKSETNPLIAELRDDLAKTVVDDACSSFDAFLAEQMSVFQTLAQMQQSGTTDMKSSPAVAVATERKAEMKRTRQVIGEFVEV